MPVLDDSEEEETETFTVALSDARNATLGDPEGTGTIRDDDADEVTLTMMTLTMTTLTMAPTGPLPPPGCRRWSSTT